MNIGWLDCDKCGKVTFDENAQIVLWIAMDADHQICEVVCPKCNGTVTERIDSRFIEHFRPYAKINDLNDKFEPLTNKMIDEWNMELELDELV